MVLRTAGLGSLALALSTSWAPAQAPAAAWGADLGFTLIVPNGWQVTGDIPGFGVSLRAPGSDDSE